VRANACVRDGHAVEGHVEQNRSVAESWSDAAAVVRALAEKGDVDDAVARLETLLTPYPQHIGLTYLTQAQLLAKAGRGAASLAPLERALARGCRYKRTWLLADTAFAPLRSLPAFEDVLARAHNAWEAATAAAKPHLTFAIPDRLPDAFGYPTLMVLHGNNSNAKETMPHWGPMADHGWVVAVPQSSEVGSSPDGFTWNDTERTAKELDLQFERIDRATQIDRSRIVLAGFSMGGLQAIRLALTKRFTVRGFIAVCAYLPTVEEFAKLIEGGAGKMLRGYVFVGEKDMSRAGARALVELFQSHNLRAQLDERPGLGHEYPDDMEATLTKALEFATK
jgi:predicted esterase